MHAAPYRSRRYSPRGTSHAHACDFHTAPTLLAFHLQGIILLIPSVGGLARHTLPLRWRIPLLPLAAAARIRPPPPYITRSTPTHLALLPCSLYLTTTLFTQLPPGLYACLLTHNVPSVYLPAGRGLIRCRSLGLDAAALHARFLPAFCRTPPICPPRPNVVTLVGARRWRPLRRVDTLLPVQPSFLPSTSPASLPPPPSPPSAPTPATPPHFFWVHPLPFPPHSVPACLYTLVFCSAWILPGGLLRSVWLWLPLPPLAQMCFFSHLTTMFLWVCLGTSNTSTKPSPPCETRPSSLCLMPQYGGGQTCQAREKGEKGESAGAKKVPLPLPDACLTHFI